MSAGRLRLGVLISGRGSNLQALIDACADPGFPAKIVQVVSNKADAYGLERAAAAGIATQIISHKQFADRESFDKAMAATLEAAGVELVCLAGFMRLLSPWFVEAWRNRVINIHPALLPSFKGLDTHARALAAGVRVHGATVHVVRPAVDDGPILVQAAVPVRLDDTEATLAARVLAEEHRIYPLAVRLLAEGHLRIAGDQVLGEDRGATPPALINPPVPAD